MLHAELSKNAGAIQVWGTTFDLGGLQELVYSTTAENGPFDVETGDWVLSLAYELRKAREQQRHSNTIIDFHDQHIPIYGCEIILPYWCMYVGALRSAFLFMTPDAEDQSVLWKMESLTHQALGQHLTETDLKNLIRYSHSFNAHNLKHAIGPAHCATAYFISLPKKKRLAELVKIVQELQPALWINGATRIPNEWPETKEEIEEIWQKARI